MGLTLAFQWLAVFRPLVSPSLRYQERRVCCLDPFWAQGEGALLGAGEMDGWRARVMMFARVSLRQCAVGTALAGFGSHVIR